MPPTPTASKPPKGAKGAGKGLGKKVGPFSLWVWLVMGGALVVVGYLYLRNRDEGGGGGGFVETVSGNQTASPVDQAMGGMGSVGNESLASQVDPASLEAMIGQQIQPYLASAGDLRGHVYELEDAFANAGYQLNEDKTWTPPGTLFQGDAPQNATVDATLGPPGAAPRPTGVNWGGQTFTTKAGLAAYLSGTQRGRPRAAAYRDWATKHPGAAQQLAGPPPKPKPRSPVKAQPRPKAQAKPKAVKKPAQKKVKVQAQKKKVRR